MAGHWRHEELQDGAADSPPRMMDRFLKGIISLITITWPHLLRGKLPSLRSKSADLQTACEVASLKVVSRTMGRLWLKGVNGDKDRSRTRHIVCIIV